VRPNQGKFLIPMIDSHHLYYRPSVPDVVRQVTCHHNATGCRKSSAPGAKVRHVRQPGLRPLGLFRRGPGSDHPSVTPPWLSNRILSLCPRLVIGLGGTGLGCVRRPDEPSLDTGRASATRNSELDRKLIRAAFFLCRGSWLQRQILYKGTRFRPCWFTKRRATAGVTSHVRQASSTRPSSDHRFLH
jgi:hypothetical protein